MRDRVKHKLVKGQHGEVVVKSTSVASFFFLKKKKHLLVYIDLTELY